MPPRCVAALLALGLMSLAVRGETPPAKVPVRTDLYGDALPPGAIARLGTARWRHENDVRSGVFSANGEVLVTYVGSPRLWLWETDTGRLIRSFREKDEEHITAFALSPDGRSLVYATEYHLHVFASRTGRLLWRSPKLTADDDWPREQVFSVAFSPDGKSIASAGGDGLVRLWDTATGRPLRRFAGYQTDVHQVAFSPDGRTLASAGKEGAVRLWDITNGKEVHTLWHNRPCVSVAFAPDGKTLAWGDNAGGAHLADVESGNQLRHIATGDEHAIEHVYFSSDGALLATCVQTLRFWDTATGRRVNVLGEAENSDGAVAPDGRTVALWGRDQCVHLWDLRSGREKPQPAGHRANVTLAVFLGAGDRVASVGDGTLRLWETATGRPLHCRDRQAPSNLTVSQDGERIATFDYDRRVRVWDAATGRPVWQSPILKMKTYLPHLSYRPDGRALVCTDGPEVKWFHPATGAILREFTTADKPISGPWLSMCTHDRWMVMQDRYWRVLIGDAETGEHRPMPAEFEACRQVFAVSPDGRYLAAARRNSKNEQESVLLWEVSTGTPCRRLIETRQKNCFAAAFTTDGRILATVQFAGHIRLWSTVTGQEVGDLGEHEVDGLAFSPDGTRLATWGRDTTILVWDVAALIRRNDLARLPRASAAEAWAKLIGPADAAHTAIWQLIADPERSVPFLAERLHPTAAPPREKAARWIADLDSNDFAARERASAELEKHADTIREPLRAALKAASSAEARRRLKSLVEAARQMAPPSGELLRSLRAVEVLEHVGTAEARRVLDKLATGADGAWLTDDARAALARLKDRDARAASRR